MNYNIKLKVNWLIELDTLLLIQNYLILLFDLYGMDLHNRYHTPIRSHGFMTQDLLCGLLIHIICIIYILIVPRVVMERRYNIKL